MQIETMNGSMALTTFYDYQDKICKDVMKGMNSKLNQSNEQSRFD
ncbi:hypothetical protein [Bacillus sp. Hm123]